MDIGTPAASHISLHEESFDDLNKLVAEPSFVAPPEKGLHGRNGRQLLQTPSATRGPLRPLVNGNQNRPAKSEFTPLLKSAAKNNISKRIASGRRRSVLPSVDETNLGSEHTDTSIGRHDATPIPQNLSSSAVGTPLAQLPLRDGAVLDNGNVMTLREQENIIDKIEKENFGLKMKIHFLEENLSKRGSEFNQTALKENATLKVDRVTLQKELHKFKKSIAQAERDADQYRRQLEEYRERIRRKQLDESVRVEITNMKTELERRDREVEELQTKYESIRKGKDSESDRLRDEIADLQADLRERDRQLEDRIDEIDELKSSAKQESNAVAEVEDDLEEARKEIEDLKAELEQSGNAVSAARQEKQSAEDEKQRAEQDLDELRDEMANKSFTTKGLSRQLEEKAAKFEDDYNELQARFQQLQNSLEEKSQSERKLQEQLRNAHKEGSSDLRRIQQDLEMSQQQCETLNRKYNNMVQQVESVTKELAIKSEEKDLLQTRHDALTTESAQLQNDLSSTRKSIASLETTIEQERQRFTHNDNVSRHQHQNALDHLTEQIDTLHRDVSSRDEQHAIETEQWHDERRKLELAKEKAEEKANGLQRTVDKLNDAQGTLTGREMRLQEALESEKERHHEEEKVLNRQIEELNKDINAKRTSAEGNRQELNNAKEELRISVREQALLKERIAELEDEIEVLQADIEQDHELAQQLQQKSSQFSDSQVSKINKEKAELQSSLAAVQIELNKAKLATKDVEARRDELESRLAMSNRSPDDTFDVQHERRELKKERQKFEKDMETMRVERDELAQINKDLEAELDAEFERATAEEHRLNMEINDLRSKQITSTDSRDKDLVSARNKVSRLESRVKDLEDQLDARGRMSPSIDISGLRHDLSEARSKEANATRRETDLKSANRELKMKLNDLERQLHEARLEELKAKSPASSVSSHSGREVSRLRQEVFDTRAQLKTIQDENQRLKKIAKKTLQDDTYQEVLQNQLDSKAEEIEDLVAKLEDQKRSVESLQAELVQIRAERDHARQKVRRAASLDDSTDIRSELKRLRTERDDARNMSIQIAGCSKDALVMKSELLRLREERGSANKRAETIEKELEIVQSRYESMLEKLTTGRVQENTTKEKEIRGLMKEILWLKAKCRREERMRQDLAWSKTYLENNEAMRLQCNQIDLRILREIGVDIDGKKYEKKLAPVQKFKAGVYCVLATIRLQRWQKQWHSVRKIGEELSQAKKSQTTQANTRKVREI